MRPKHYVISHKVFIAIIWGIVYKIHAANAMAKWLYAGTCGWQVGFAFQRAALFRATVLAHEKRPISASLQPLGVYIYAFGSQSCATRLIFAGSAELAAANGAKLARSRSSSASGCGDSLTPARPAERSRAVCARGAARCVVAWRSAPLPAVASSPAGSSRHPARTASRLARLVRSSPFLPCRTRRARVECEMRIRCGKSRWA